MTFQNIYLTNGAYGYPGGQARRVSPIALICIHQTGNSPPVATAREERDYANRAGSGGPSAHTYIDRAGGGVHAYPTSYAGWSNGVLRSPKLTVPGVQAVVDFAVKWNPNEAYVREVEACAYLTSYPITDVQEEDIASLIAQDSIDSSIPISRATVHLHSDLDSVTRPNDPVPAAGAEAWVASIIARANTIKAALVESGMTWQELLAAVDAEYQKVAAERDQYKAQAEQAVADLAVARVKATQIEFLAQEIQAS